MLSLVEAPHDSGVGWKQFMMLLEKVLVCGGVAFHPPLRVPGRRKGFIRVTAVPGLPVYCLISSVVDGVEVCPPLSDLGRALFSQAQLVLWGHPGVSSWLSHEGLKSVNEGSVTSLRHPARSCARGAHSVKAAGRLKWARWR